MLLQGLVLMVVGLFMVFSFLLLLVLILMACEKIIPRFSHILPDEPPKAKTSRAIQPGSASSTSDSDEKIAVAIAAAIAQRKK
jgi:sodium pump decarboxylase gamma subunit